VNTDAPWPTAAEARERVLKIQTKLHQWATDDHHRRFDDLYNLVYDPAVLVHAWTRVRSNRGARTAGVDGETAHYIAAVRGEQAFLSELRDDLKARRFQPVPVRERMIPKASGKLRRLGIATVRDRVAQAALKTVLEPIFEATFSPCSYGFRPRRQAHDAIAETQFLASRSYEWIVEGDIKACFDEISHSAVLGRMRDRIADRRVMDLVKAFLKAGILGEDGELRDTDTGAPQGGIVSPLISNIALSILDDHFAAAWEAMGDAHGRAKCRRNGLATYRLIRYADDWLLLVAGDRADAERLRAEAAEVLLPMGLRLSEEKTKIVHIDQGFDFLGMRIQRHQKQGATKRLVYTYPSRKALASVKAKVRDITANRYTNQTLAVLLHRLNRVLQGWTNYHGHGAAAKTFAYLSAFTWRRVMCWLRHKHHRTGWQELRRRYLSGWWPTQEGVNLFNPAAVAIVRYRYRGTSIPSPWASMKTDPAVATTA